MRTITHTRPGAARFELTLDAGAVVVYAEDRDTATVTLEPVRPGDTEAARLIETATATSDGERFAVRVPSDGTTGTTGTTVVQRGPGTVYTSAGTVTGSVTGMVIGSGVTIVNGRVISGHGTTIIHGNAGVRVTVRLPLGSAVSVRTRSADITTDGRLVGVDTETVSGDTRITTAAIVTARTTSGDVLIDAARQVAAQTVSGDVTVRALAGPAGIRTVSGDVAVHAVRACTVQARSVSGDITVTAEPGVEVDTDTRTVSGRVRTRRR